MEQNFQGSCKRQRSEFRLLKSSQLSLCRTRKIVDFRCFHYTGQTKNRPVHMQQHEQKLTLEKKLPAKCIEEPRTSTSRSRKPSTDKRFAVRKLEEQKELTESDQNQEMETSKETDVLFEKEPRTYAQMIAYYNEVIYGPSSIEILNDSLSSAMINGVRKTLFSTTSVGSLKWSNKHHGVKDISVTSFDTFREATFSSVTCMTRYYYRYDDKISDEEITGKSKELQRCSSYATMIEKYSNAMNLGIDCCGWSGSVISKRNVSTKLHEAPKILIEGKTEGSRTKASSSSERGEMGKEKLNEGGTAKPKEQSEEQWVTKVDDIIKDLKRITAKTEAIETKTNDKRMVQPVNERAYWLDRVVNAHKKRIRDRKLMLEKASINMTAHEIHRPNEPVAVDAENKLLATSSENLPKKPRQVTASDKSSIPIVEYLRRGAPGSSSTSKSSTQTPTTIATSSAKEPQIELRMTPSQNESVVSINVDEQAAKTAGSSTGEQLSVVISSKKKKTGNVDAGNPNPRPDFGSMQISISENTIPVKQIEFSINGKPVSELKSIVARADKLDVYSSMDKVEIRIPSKDRNAVASEQSRNVSATSAKPVLNLQIAAKFNDPRSQQPREAEAKKSPPYMPPSTTPATPMPPSPPVTPVKPPRSQTLFTPDTAKSTATKGETKKADATKSEAEKGRAKGVDVLNVTDVKRSANVTEIREVDTFSATSVHASVPKEEKVPSVMTDVPSTANPNEAVFQKNVNEPPANRRSNQPTMNNENASSADRTPSNMIPWWSSEDSFRKIRKKDSVTKISSTSLAIGSMQTGRDSKAIPETAKPNQTDAPSPRTIDSKDFAKVDTTEIDDPKDAVTNKLPAVKNVKPVDPSPPIANYVRIKTPLRWVPIASAKARKPSKPRRIKGRVVKKVKYRVKKDNTRRRMPGIVKKKSAVSKISPVSSTKVVKYISVVPQTAKTEEKSSTRTTGVDKPMQKTNDPKSKQEDGKMEKLAIARVVDSQIGKANIQNSNEILKKKSESVGDANRSADVSAESASSAANVGSGKEKKQQGTDGTAGKSLSAKPVNEEQRIKEILKSMKPIEKRKDGTLIDYGVIVPSRTSGKVRQVPRIRGNASIVTKESLPNREKSVFTAKAPSTKNQTLTERKSAEDQAKIQESEKTRAARRLLQFSNVNIRLKYERERTAQSELKVSPEKAESEKTKQKALVKINTDETERTKDLKEPAKLPSSALSTTSPKSLQKALSISVKSSSLDKPKSAVPSSSVTSSKQQVSEKKETESTPKAVEQKKASLEGTNVAPPKIADKTVSRDATPPQTGTITLPGSQKPSAETTKRDNPPLKDSGSLGKSKTAVAPLKEAIEQQSPSNRSKPAKVSIDGKGKTKSKLATRRTVDATTNAKDKVDGIGSGRPGDAPKGTPQGSFDQSPQSCNTETPVMCMKQDQDQGGEAGKVGGSCESGNCLLYSGVREKSEKDMLYSSWLRRFDDKFDDDKAV